MLGLCAAGGLGSWSKNNPIFIFGGQQPEMRWKKFRIIF
jgi:hypothetical protein